MNGIIFNIQKFCINDGPGIRTTIFMKGCPLNCAWCHNPESKSVKPEIFYDPRKCILCTACAAICKNGCHSFADGHIYDRSNCLKCGSCAKECVANALEVAGYEISVEDAMKEVMKDEVFYKNSGGGMTLSGGEPMSQIDFTHALLMAAKGNNLHTCMETCGYSSRENYDRVRELVNIFLFDYKLTDPVLHKKYTGVSNERILDNLYHLDKCGSEIVLRCPIIPTVNDTPEHFKGIADTANKLKNILEINIEPYHPLGNSKSELLDRDYSLKDLTFPENEAVEKWMEDIRKMTDVTVKKA